MRTIYFKQILIVFLCLSSTACISVGPDYQQPAMDVTFDWNGADGNAVLYTKVEGSENLSQWWQTLNDPLLSELVEEALRSSPDLRTARSLLRQVRAQRIVAATEYYPTVSATGSTSLSKSDGEATRESYSVGFDASWELDLFGGVRRSVEASQASLDASEANLQDTQVSLAAEVATNYFEVRSLQNRLKIALENLDSQGETLQLTKWREQAGLIDSQDVDQAQSNMEQTRAQIPSLKTSLAEAEHRLEILLGKLPGSLHQRLSSGGELPVVPGQIVLGIPADTLRQRPDIRAAERKLAAETARVGVAEAARYPSFKLSGSIGLDALTLSGLGESGAGSLSLLGGITEPIFNAKRLKKQVEIQDAVREQAQIAYEQTVLNALGEVENALVNLYRSQERTSSLDQATISIEKAAAIARQKYAAGLIDFQSVLDTERSVRNLQDSLATSRTNSVLALISLYKALGGGWSSQGSDIQNKDQL
ncbi:efflux transporter outer membrane subunit [Malonomonas rubra]|uniref:efflux transporter outer membrane subunit n=1 Tax=Malonomonas rubra TaxID=57040 RepID=UPI0026EE84F4|nr:efflux transporter outer membrane subunit [Malonomonas rubra]